MGGRGLGISRGLGEVVVVVVVVVVMVGDEDGLRHFFKRRSYQGMPGESLSI